MIDRSKNRKSLVSRLLSKQIHILALHGFSGRGEDFKGFSPLCGSHMKWHCPDLPGHGPNPTLACDPKAMVEFIHRQPLEKPRIVMGYSMGARATLLHAVSHPDYWDALILISGTAGLESAVKRAERSKQDQQLVQRLKNTDVSAFLDYWQKTPLIRSQLTIRPDWLERMQVNRSQHTVEGLSASLEAFGQARYPNLWSSLSKLQCPVLLISGELDSKYCALAERMQNLLPLAQWKVIRGVGHMPHLEAPEQTATIIKQFRNTFFNMKRSELLDKK